jgi:hypothetical protein
VDFDMLGLWSLPDRTPLWARVTGKVEGDGFVVENLHYQSVPGLYVTANLDRPARVEAGSKPPAAPRRRRSGRDEPTTRAAPTSARRGSAV